MRRVVIAMFLVLSALVAVSVGGEASPVSALPIGFTDSIVTSVSGPTAVEALPDGRVVVLEQDGAIKRIDARSRSAAPVVTTMGTFGDVCANSERGVLGFTIDPDFATNEVVYVYRTIRSAQPGGCHNRVSRFVMGEAGIDINSEQVLVDNISSNNGNHNGGDLEVANDGFLYISVGDAGRDPRGDSGGAGANDAAQDLSLLNGKILRVDRVTGIAAPGNPFTGPGTAECRLRGNTASTPTTTCREIFAVGLRNPYRFAFDPNAAGTRFFINDVGQGTREEVSEGAIGANYGWPVREGRCPQGQNPPCPGPPAGLTDPLTDYGRTLGRFITGGAFIPDGSWPADFDGGYLFADGATGSLWLRAADGSVDYANPFLDASGPIDMTFVRDAAGTTLWYVQSNGQVRRVDAPVPVQPTGDSGPLRYEALATMDRRFDTRTNTPPNPMGAGDQRMLTIGAPAGAKAALVNLTLVRPDGDNAFLTAWEPGTSRPMTSNVNAPRGAVVGNSSIVPLNGRGELMLYSQVRSHVVIDVAGFFVDGSTPSAAGRFVSLAPARVVDTRLAAHSDNTYAIAAQNPGRVVSVPLAGVGGLPPDAGEVSAVALTIAGINNNGSTGGFATVLPTGTQRPLASSVNVNGDSDVRANLAVVPVSADGRIDVYLEGVDNVTIDVAGYFTGDASQVSNVGRFHLTLPAREVDTRSGSGPAGIGTAGSVSLNPASVPDSASAIAQNITLAPAGGRGFVTAYPADPRPTVSSINASGAGQIRGALGLVALAAGGSEQIYAEVDNGLVIDSFGWFE